MRLPSLSALVLALASLAQPYSQPAHAALDDINQSRWQSQPSMLHARAAHAVVSSQNAIYALGGTGEGGRPVLAVEKFDGSRWQAETTLPGNGLNAPAAVLLNNNIYLLAGFNTSTNVPTDKVWKYDTARKTWQAMANMPAARGGHAAAVLNGQIHAVGGGNSESTLADHLAYDPRSNSWRKLAPLPRAEGSPALVAFAGKLYAIGGRSGMQDFGDVYVYDSAKDSWSSSAAIEPRGTAGAVPYCGTIYVFGGESQKTARNLADVLRLDLSQNRWLHDKPMPAARNFARAVLFQNAVYVVGGSREAGSSHDSSGSKIVESFHTTCPR